MILEMLVYVAVATQNPDGKFIGGIVRNEKAVCEQIVAGAREEHPTDWTVTDCQPMKVKLPARTTPPAPESSATDKQR